MTTRVAVVGAGRGGRALIQLLAESPEVEIVAVADVDAEAPGLLLARERAIPTLSDPLAVFRYAPDVVIEATGEPEVLEDLLRERPVQTEVIGAKSARLLWDIIEARAQTARRLEALLLLTQSLTSTLHLETIFDLIVETAVNLLEAEVAGLWVIQEDSGEPALRASAGTAEILERSSATLTSVEELVREVAQGKGGGPRAGMIAAVGTFAGVPLMKEGRVLGVLGVIGGMARPFTEGDHDLLDSFASQAAIALDNARLYEEARNRAAQLMILHETTRALNAEPSLDVLLQRLVERARELVGARYGALAVLDEEGRVAQLLSAGLTQEEREQIGHLPQGRGLLGVVLRGGRPVRLDDISAHPLSSGFPSHHPVMRSLLGVPMLIEGKALGALYLTEKGGGFTAEDEELMTTLAADAAVAIERARLLEELRVALEGVEASKQRIIQTERLRALGEMASGVAHDFNNVLAAILGRAQLLLSELVDDPKLRRGVEVIERVALDGARIVGRIQESARVRQDRALTTVAPNALVVDVLEATQPRWKDQAEVRGIRYKLVKELGEVPSVTGDPSELREVLMNLVLNALDAMPAGGTLTISTRVASHQSPVTNERLAAGHGSLDAESVEIAVADTGCGMSEEVRQRAFELFFTTKGAQSTGLGLSVAYGIIHRHGGDIAIESREGEGTTLTIRLPVGKGVAVEREVEPPAAAPKRATVLVIDDEEEVRRVLAEILAAQGHTVLTAADGKEGLRRFREERFDLVLTDLGMPGMSGWQVARAIKGEHPTIPVILITGWGEQLDPEAVRERIVEFILAKPFKIEEVLGLMARALEGRASLPDR